MERTEHITLNSKYRIVIERAASTKGVLGYKVEANGDDIDLVKIDIATLKERAEQVAQEPPVATAPVKLDATKGE